MSDPFVLARRSAGADVVFRPALANRHGEALVSVLDEKGTPTVTERAWIVPPASQIGPITDVQRATIQKATVSLYGHYNEAIDRDSAYEILKARTETRIEGAGRAGGAGQAGRAGPAGPAGWGGGETDSGMSETLTKILLGSRGPRGRKREGLLEAITTFNAERRTRRTNRFL